MGQDDLLLTANWLFTLGTAAWLSWLFIHQRCIFIKPSIWLVSYTHLFFQWPCTLLWTEVSQQLHDATILFLVIHLYVVCTLSLTMFILRKDAWRAWQKVTTSPSMGWLEARRVIILLSAITALLLTIYFIYVPPRSTGLYAILFDPASAKMAREHSLKLLINPLPKYAYFLMLSAVIPLLAALASLVIADNMRRPILVFGMLGLLIICALAASLSGARSGMVMLTLIVAATLLIRRGFCVNPLLLLLLLPAALMPAVALSIMREGHALTKPPQMAWDYLGYVGERAFAVPFEIGTWYLLHLQAHGPIGIGAYPKLAWITGGEAIDAPHQIGLIYAPLVYGYEKTLPTISAAAGFLFTSHAYLGLIAFPLTVFATLFLDIALLAYRHVHPILLPALAGALFIGTLQFIQSEYTVVWITHGFGVKLILALSLSWLLLHWDSLKIRLASFLPQPLNLTH